MDHRGKIVTYNIEKPKSYTINFRLRYEIPIVGVDYTGKFGGTPQTQTCGNLLIKHNNSGTDLKMAAKRYKA